MNQLKKLRKERHISQADVAAALGIKPAAVSKYETGRVPLSEEAILKICSLFEVSADELLGISGREAATAGSVASSVLGQILPASVTMEDYLLTLLNTVAKQQKQMEQTIRNLNACGIPTTTISRVTAMKENAILALLNENKQT